MSHKNSKPSTNVLGYRDDAASRLFVNFDSALKIQAAEREAREETGLEIEAGEVLEVFESITPDAQGKTCYHYVIVDFLCRLKSGELRAGGDALEAKWCRAEELTAMKVSEAATKVVLKAFEVHRH